MFPNRDKLFTADVLQAICIEVHSHMFDGRFGFSNVNDIMTEASTLEVTQA